MTMVTKNAIEQGYQKMLKLPQDKLVLLLGIIDQFSNPQTSDPPVRLGIADGKYKVPDDINQDDDKVAELFGVTL